MEENSAQLAGLAARPDPFIGLTEAIVWAATRDAQLARSVADASRGPGASKVAEWIILIKECQARGVTDPKNAFLELSAAAAIGDISSRGRNGAGGFEIIPADDWIEAQLAYGNEPDAFKPAGSPGWVFDKVWTHVRFIRADVLRLWPEITNAGAPYTETADEASQERVVVTATAKAVADCKKWLRTKFEDPDTKNLRRDDFKAMVLADPEFEGRLSGRGFRDAWTDVAKDFPDRRGPGPKPA